MNKLSFLDRVKRRYRHDGLSGLCKQGAFKIRSRVFPVQLLSVSAELTNKCNLECGFCFVDKKRDPGFMSWDLFTKIVDEAASMKAPTFGLNYGGESLCHPEFKRFLKYLMEKRNSGEFKNVGWVTNGMLFSQDIADLVCELGVDSIGFSLEGFSEINDKMRAGCSYEKVKENILYLLEKRGSRKKPAIRINTLNPAGDMDFIKYWMETVELVAWSTLRDMDNRIIDRSFFDHGWFTPQRCTFPFNYMPVFWNGFVTGCCSDGYGKMNLGNANNQTIREIWNGQQFKDLRKGMANELCQKCDFWKIEFVPAVEKVFNGLGEVTYQVYWRRYERLGK